MRFFQKIIETLLSMPSMLSFLLLFTLQSSASSNQSLVYQGRIVRPDGAVANSGSITFTLSIYSPSPSTCLLYQETQTLSMVDSQGLFSLTLGAGTRIDGGAHTFNQAFINGSTLSSLTCATGNSYASASTDDRSLVVSFNDAGTVVSLSEMKIKSVPFALQAHEVDGWGLSNLVKVSSIGSPTTFTTTEMANAKALAGAACALNEILKWNGSAWACASDATSGSPNDASFAAKGIVQGDTDAATSGLTFTSGVIKVNSGTAANQIVKLDASAKLPAVDGSALTNLDPSHLSAAVPINKGGTGQITAILGFNALSPITTKGDLITSDGTNNVRLPIGSNGYVLTADSAQGSGMKWAPTTAGTVTSVSSANADIAVATGTSTPVLTLNSGTGANQIVKLDGSAKLPAVDGSALTNLNAGNISSGTLPINRGGTAATSFAANAVIVSNGTGSALQAMNCTLGQVITFDASGYAVCGAGGATGFVNGGNSFGANATLGTNDNYSLGFKTNNLTRMTITSGGDVGIGMSNPRFPLEVAAFNGAAVFTSSSVIANTPYTVVEHSQGPNYSGVVNAITQGGDTYGAYHAGVAQQYGETPGNPNYYSLIGERMNNNGSWDNNSPGALATGDYLPGVGFAGQNTAGMSIGASIQGRIDGTVGTNILPTALIFRTSTTNTISQTEKMRISSLGYVGIGTTAPAGILDVQGGTSTTGNGASINIVAQSGLASGNTNGGSINLTAGSANGTGAAGTVNVNKNGLNFTGGTGGGGGAPVAGFNGIYSSGLNRLDIATNGTSRFSILPNGNVVMASPTTRVIGNTFLDYNFNINGFAMDDTSAYIKTNSLNRVIVDASGNVGIGATTTNTKLYVSGGPIVAAPGSSSTACVDLSTGNIHVSTYSSTNTIKIGGLVDGGAYTLILTGYTAGQTVTVQAYTDTTCTSAVTNGVDFGGSSSAVTSTFTAVGNTQLVTFIYSASRGVVYASASTNFYR